MKHISLLILIISTIGCASKPVYVDINESELESLSPKPAVVRGYGATIGYHLRSNTVWANSSRWGKNKLTSLEEINFKKVEKSSEHWLMPGRYSFTLSCTMEKYGFMFNRFYRTDPKRKRVTINIEAGQSYLIETRINTESKDRFCIP